MRLKFLIFIFTVLCFPSFCVSATYYLRNDGTNAAPTAGCTNVGAMAEADFNGGSFSGNDIIKVCDDGDAYGFLANDIQPGTTKHWAKLEFRLDNATHAGLFFCSDGDGGDHYAAAYLESDTTLKFRSFDNDATHAEEDSDVIEFLTGDTLGISTECVGSGAVSIDYWKNPTGDCPSEWGAADGTLSATPTYRATGKNVGVFSRYDQVLFDNFSAGDW